MQQSHTLLSAVQQSALHDVPTHVPSLAVQGLVKANKAVPTPTVASGTPDGASTGAGEGADAAGNVGAASVQTGPEASLTQGADGSLLSGERTGQVATACTAGDASAEDRCELQACLDSGSALERCASWFPQPCVPSHSMCASAA